MDVQARAKHVFEREFDAAPPTVVDAPGRINLIGGHTDYNDGFVLPTGINRRTAVAAAPRSDDVLRVHSATIGETVLAGITPRDDWTDYVAGVRWALRDADYSAGGADLAVVSRVLVGAGLSSSAALAVATCRALDDINELDLDGDTAARLCTRAENEFVGVPCGILDGYTAANAPVDGALELDCRTLDATPVPLQTPVVVLDTGIRHDLADSAYNERVATCRRGVDLLSDLLAKPLDSLRDVSVDAFEQVAADLPATVRARCRHVVTENERVRAAASALRAEDHAKAGALLDASHQSLRDDYEVSCDELDAAAAAGRATSGILGSRMTGGGFGGCTVHLVAPEAEVDKVTPVLADAYRDRVNADPSVYACRPSPGAYVSSVSST